MRMRTKGGPKAKSDHKTQHHRTSSVPRVDLDFTLGRVGEGGGRRIHHDGNDLMLSGQCAVTNNRTKHTITRVTHNPRSVVNSIRDDLGGRATAGGVELDAKVLVWSSGVVAFIGRWGGRHTGREGGREGGKTGYMTSEIVFQSALFLALVSATGVYTRLSLWCIYESLKKRRQSKGRHEVRILSPHASLQPAVVALSTTPTCDVTRGSSLR